MMSSAGPGAAAAALAVCFLGRVGGRGRGGGNVPPTAGAASEGEAAAPDPRLPRGAGLLQGTPSRYEIPSRYETPSLCETPSRFGCRSRTDSESLAPLR